MARSHAGSETRIRASVQRMIDETTLAPPYTPANHECAAQLDETYRIVE